MTRRDCSQPGIPLCPPEGDAGTGHGGDQRGPAAVGQRLGGHLGVRDDRPRASLSRVHEEIDIVATPDGTPVAMAHSNNGSSDLDAWIALFGQVGRALGADADPDELYGALLPLALAGDPDAGGLLAGQLRLGRAHDRVHRGPAAVRPQARSAFTLENFMRAMLFASLCALRTGIDILTREEGVVIEEIRGHGGFFKGGDTGQRLMAAALVTR